MLRLLAGESIAELARETGRPRRQLSAWRRRFLAGGEAYLDGRPERTSEVLRRERDELAARVANLEADHQTHARGVPLAAAAPDPPAPHPYCSERYAHASEEPGVRSLRVSAWGTYVLVRGTRAGPAHATGIRPLASLRPGADLQAGLDELRRAGIASISLVTDPIWSPSQAALARAFDACRPFRVHYVVDHEAPLRYRKRHRNRIAQARDASTVKEVSLAAHLGRWHELYRENVAKREIPQPFAPTYFERLAELSALRTIAVLVDDEIVALTLWLCHRTTLYFHDAVSSPRGFGISATYAAFAHAIEQTDDYRSVLLGGSAAVHDDRLDGLAMFRRGFSNASATSYLCSASFVRSPQHK